MSAGNDAIRPVDAKLIDESGFARRFVGCIVLSRDGKIALQQRDSSGCSFPDHLATFGGAMDSGEKPMGALIRELNEELGAVVEAKDVIDLGAFTEDATDHAALIYGYFWHDRAATITGCYEGRMREYATCAEALRHPKVTDDLRWLLQECVRRALVKA